MLSWIILFLILSLIAALFGFRGVAGQAMTIARFLFSIFVFLLILSLILHLLGVAIPAASVPPPVP